MCVCVSLEKKSSLISEKQESLGIIFIFFNSSLNSLLGHHFSSFSFLMVLDLVKDVDFFYDRAFHAICLKDFGM